MAKPDVIQLPSGDWAVVKSLHTTKGAADKAVNEARRAAEQAETGQKTFCITLTEAQVQKVIDALTKE